VLLKLRLDENVQTVVFTLCHIINCYHCRSDIEIIETEDGWLAVRTSAVEEQSTACQLMVLLVEKLQVP
jgi:hypothetical protein